MAQTQGASRPKVILLSLNKQPWFDEMYKSLLTELKAKADVEEITGAAAASTLFTGDYKPNVVIASDEGLAQSKFKQQRTEAVRFVQNGGTLIFGLQVPSFTRPSDVKDLFAAFGIPWETGDYHRTEFDVNKDMKLISTTGLVPRYSQKALHLKHVERSHAVYLPSTSSHIQSMVFAPSPIEDLTQTPAAIRSCGSGKVGYLGDVNAEEETNKVVLAMSGLLD